VFIIPWCASNHFKADISSLEEYSMLQFTVTDLIANLAAIVVTDYVSLLFVRRFINAARKRPIVATLLSLLVGFAVVVIGIFVFNFLWVIMIYLLEGFITNTSYLLHDTWVVSKRSFDFCRIGSLSSGMLPAFIIHLWLPLFALSSVVVKLLYLIFRAVEWAQWFLKQGNAHPFRAIGVVATIIVFGSAMLVKEGWALLGVLERS
jgi:ABC-type phosphate transport system permease subunit